MKRSVLVVGDTGGLGDRFCKHFLAQGDEVRGLSRRTNILPNDFGEDWPHYCVNASDYADLENFAEELFIEGWRPKIILNCTGLADQNSILMVSAEKFMDMITSNLFTTFAINQVFGKLLLGDPEAVICSFSSIHVPQQTKGAGSYIIAKSAVEAMTSVFANDLSGLGPRYICFRLPYVKDVGMSKQTTIQSHDTQNEDTKNNVKSFEEVIKSVVYHINKSSGTTDLI